MNMALKMNFARQVMRLQRNFPYPHKAWILHRPPLPTKEGGSELVILSRRKTFLDALWSAAAWMKYLGDRLALRLVVDGKVDPPMQKAFHRLFPNGIVCPVSDCIDGDLLSHRHIRSFYQNHRFGRTLVLKLALQRQTGILFSDPDVLVFKQPSEIIEHLNTNTPCFLAEPRAAAVSPWIKHRAERLSLKITNDFNSGVMFLPQGSLCISTCEKLLEGWSPEIPDHFPEQTICDVLLTKYGAASLPVDSYVVNSTGMWFWEKDIDYSNVKLRHFVGNVRHRMYLAGYPLVKKKLLRGTIP